MKIIVDDKIPFIRGVLEPFAEMHYLSPGDITPGVVKDADALIIRTRTHCDARLLEGSSVRFIATATIGYDHIDREYCKQKGIEWQNAPGCNAPSVAQYVAGVLALWGLKNRSLIDGRTIGIVGVGNVGREVEKMCLKLGLKVLRCDPPRAESEGQEGFVSLEEIARKADFVTFHTPLIKGGAHPTLHLADEAFFGALERKPVVINAARGGVVDEAAMKRAFADGRISDMAIDCWENEPHIDRQLMDQCLIATPHIAGYSADGKSNATRMAVANVAGYFHLSPDYSTIVAPSPEPKTIDAALIEEPHPEYLLYKIMLRTYNPISDTERLRQAPDEFERQRGDYPFRREYQAYSVVNAPEVLRNELENIGFEVVRSDR